MGRLGLGAIGNRSTNRRTQVIEEDEYIADINGSATFATTAFALNPGQAGTFPWGSKIAQLYEEYDYEYVEFYYKREVSEFATNGQAGKVILSFDYDANDGAPTTKQQVEDTVPHVDAMPCVPRLGLAIDCARIRKNDSKYVRAGAQPANTDLKTYDAGNLFVSTIGCTNATLIGELHVRYRVRLSEPVLEAASVVGGVVHFTGTAPTTANNFATARQESGASPSLAGITAAANVITFPSGIPGNYLLFMTIAGSTSASALGFTASAGASNLNLFVDAGVRDALPAAISAASASSANVASIAFSISVATTGGVMTVSPSTLVGGDGMDLWIISLPASVLTLAEQEEIEIQELQQENKLLNDRLMRLEQMMFVNNPAAPLGWRLAAEEKEDEDSEGSVMIHPRKPRRFVHGDDSVSSPAIRPSRI